MGATLRRIHCGGNPIEQLEQDQKMWASAAGARFSNFPGSRKKPGGASRRASGKSDRYGFGPLWQS
jgi:hypothetical protein